MKSFSRRGFLIANSAPEMKWVYTFFLLLIALGFVTIAIYQYHVIGWGIDAIQRHYRGSETGLSFPKEFLELLSTAHAHAFIMGLVYLTLAHILIATRTTTKTRGVLIWLGFIATAGDILLPWGVRYLSPHLAFAFAPIWLGEWVAYGGMILVPLYDIWWKKPHGQTF